MKNATECGKKLTSLLKKLPAVSTDELPQRDPVVTLVHALLMWETTEEKADVAIDKLLQASLDYNDLRVSLAHEIVDMIGSRYPRAMDRAHRLRAMLRDVYHREHDVDLASLADMGKRDVRKYLETLEGITPFIAARVMLLCYDVHAIPVDEQLRKCLVDAGAADEDADAGEVSNWLCRQIKAGDGVEMHRRLQAWAEQQSSRSKSRSKKKPTAKKSTTKKKTTSGRKKTARSSSS